MRKEIVLLHGVEYEYQQDKEYLLKGHVYCTKCNERIDGDVIEILNRKFILKNSCKCKRDQEKREKERERQEEIARIKKVCFPSLIQQSYTLDAFYDKSTKEYIAAKNYVDKYIEMKEQNIGILFYGSVGSGKSYLASAIANAVIEMYMDSVRMRNFSQIINELQQGGFDMDKNSYINSLVSVQLLILDDLGMERNTSYALEQVYNIINSRCLKQKPTIITTNLKLEDISNTQDGIEYQRIYSRVLEMCVPVLVHGEDYRKRIGKEKLEKAKSMLLR